MTQWLHELRLRAVLEAVQRSGARTVADLGCGDGDLLVRMAQAPHLKRVVGIDICQASLGRLRQRLDQLPAPATAEIELLHGSIVAGPSLLPSCDCAVIVETIEHLEPGLLSKLEQRLFLQMRPRAVVVTTPNAEFNHLLGVPPHRFRHPDHRFEWDRASFRRWADGAALRHGYKVTFEDIAGNHPRLGGASQMAVFAADDASRLAA